MKPKKRCQWVEGCIYDAEAAFPVETVNGKTTAIELCGLHAKIFEDDTHCQRL